jgi:hypothetical protein
MLKINQCFSKHCGCHLQGEYVMDRHFWKSHIKLALSGEFDLMVLTGEAKTACCCLIGDKHVVMKELLRAHGKKKRRLKKFW